MNAETARQVKIAIKNLSVASGAVKVLDNLTLDIYDNEILAIVGSKGVGKTTLLDCISGFAKPQGGEITFNHEKITGLAPDKIVQLGLARTFQIPELLPGQTVLDNLMAARHILTGGNILTGAIYYGPAVNEETDQRRAVEDIINFLEIEAVRDQKAGLLSASLQKHVELGRALALEPEVLLLDEPYSGVEPAEKAALARFIKDIFKGEGDIYPRTPLLRDGVKCIVITAADAESIAGIADRVVVLGGGNSITG
jgi:branched-chain amino acid transport system ATP-binding protein